MGGLFHRLLRLGGCGLGGGFGGGAAGGLGEEALGLDAADGLAGGEIIRLVGAAEDPEALAAAYPGVPTTLGAKAKYRHPDAITGGTWEALERILQRAGHFVGGLAKIELAREMGLRMQPEKNTSRSFQAFAAGIALLVEE